MSNDLVSIVVGVLVLGLVITRQVRKRAVREDRGARFMLILGVIGIIEVVVYLKDKPFNATAIGVLAGSLVVAAAFGAIRAYTTRVWRENGVLYRQGNAITIVLWLVAIGAHFGLDLLVDRSGSGSGLATSALVLYIAVTLGVQRLVVLARANQMAALAA